MFFQETLLFASEGRSHYRIPSIIVTKRGTVLAFSNDRKDSLSDHAAYSTLAVARKEVGGEWSDPCELAGFEGWSFSIGSAVYDGEADRVMLHHRRSPVARKEFGSYTEEKLAELDRRERENLEKAAPHGITPGDFIMLSEDDGLHFSTKPMCLRKATQAHWDGSVAEVGGSTHGSAHGIQLRHGAHKGRLLCPSRTSIGTYDSWSGLQKCVYNNAIYSDDHGESWQASNCVQLATGEGTLIERGDGSILYNSRAYYYDGLRYLATSTDGGATYHDFRTDAFLRESVETGCNASFLRVELSELGASCTLPESASDLTVFCNPRYGIRRQMTACFSFDGGERWQGEKEIFGGSCAYSSLEFNPQDKHFYLLYERGRDMQDGSPYGAGLYVAEFDAEWLLGDK